MLTNLLVTYGHLLTIYWCSRTRLEKRVWGVFVRLGGGSKTRPYCSRATFTTFTSWFLFSCMLIFELPARTSSSVMIFP